MAEAKRPRLLEKALGERAELRKKLILAIALAPPKSRRKRGMSGANRRGRQ